MDPEGQSRLVARGAFADLPLASAASRGLIAIDRDGLGIASMLVSESRRAALIGRVRDRLSIELPSGPRRTAAGDIALIGTGNGAWLATHADGAACLMPLLQEAAGDLAALCDQSDGYAVLRLAGPGVRDVLGRIVPIDLHARAFAAGDAAVTVASHMGATLWRLDDVDDTPVFEIAVFRSLAASLWSALTAAASL